MRQSHPLDALAQLQAAAQGVGLARGGRMLDAPWMSATNTAPAAYLSASSIARQ